MTKDGLSYLVQELISALVRRRGVYRRAVHRADPMAQVPSPAAAEGIIQAIRQNQIP
jgi:hypothetical protein